MLPQIHKPLSVVLLEDGRRFFIDRKDADTFAKSINESFMVKTPWGYTNRKKFQDIMDFDASTPEDQFLISLPHETRLRLEAEMRKHVDACGKEMPLHRMRLTVDSFEQKK